jgi:hypothetical protein
VAMTAPYCGTRNEGLFLFSAAGECIAFHNAIMPVVEGHVPVVNMEEKLVGIVSPQRVTRFLKQYYGSA